MLTKKSLLNNKKLQKVVFYSYTGLVLYLTLSPVDKIRPPLLESFLFKEVDKIIHAAIFVVFVITCYITYKIKYPSLLIVASFFGLLIEILQKIMPTGRSFDWIDWLFDLLGGLIGIVIIHIIKPHLKKKLMIN